MLRAKAFMARALLTAAVVVAAAPASGQDAVPIITPTMPNYVGFGLGVTTDYIGADDYFFGGLPLARYQFEDSDRHASLVGTFVDLQRAVETAPKMILALRQLGRPDGRNLYYDDRQWERAWAGGTAEWMQESYLDVNQRAAFFQYAYSSAPAMVMRNVSIC